MVSKAVSDPSALVALSQDLKDSFVTLAGETGGAMVCVSSDTVRTQLRARVQELGEACCAVVQASNVARSSPDDPTVKRELALASRECTRKVNGVLVALQAGAQGTQACLTAASAVEGVMVDLETSAMFASAGSVDNTSGSFKDHQPKVLESARGLIDCAKKLVAGAAGSQEALSEAAESSHMQFLKLVETLKLSLDTLGGSGVDAQVLLLNAARDVGKCLTDLLKSTRKAAGKSAEVRLKGHGAWSRLTPCGL